LITLVLLLLIMIAIGLFIYISKYSNKEKPKVGIKRDNLSGYFKDYANLKLYWTSIGFIFLGVTVLIAILIIEMSA